MKLMPTLGILWKTCKTRTYTAHQVRLTFTCHRFVELAAIITRHPNVEWRGLIQYYKFNELYFSTCGIDFHHLSHQGQFHLTKIGSFYAVFTNRLQAIEL